MSWLFKRGLRPEGTALAKGRGAPVELVGAHEQQATDHGQERHAVERKAGRRSDDAVVQRAQANPQQRAATLERTEASRRRNKCTVSYRCRRRISSVLIACSFATIRFFAVCRHTMNAPLLLCLAQ